LKRRLRNSFPQRSQHFSVSIFADIGIDHLLRFLDVSGATSNQPTGKPIKTLTHAGLRRPAIAPVIAASLRLDRTSRPFATVGPRSSRLCGVGQLRAMPSSDSLTGPTRPAAPP
jgi:hypothetical protein